MSKQVIAAVVNLATESLTTAPNSTEQAQRNLYVSVKTFNTAQQSIGYRVVNMYHYGTRNWLQQHCWWAMHNGHVVECVPSTDEEITEYLAKATVALAEKFNHVKAA